MSETGLRQASEAYCASGENESRFHTCPNWDIQQPHSH